MSSILLLMISAIACVMALYAPLQCRAERRDLTEITYRFTNCESTSHDGPRVIQQCLPLYEEMGSPLANKGTLFQLENLDGEYDGAQGFRLPRDDLYNITVAGAIGGEGVCNFRRGFGRVISAQVRLTTDYEYLIMVGHRGTSVCDVPANANHPICQLPRPTNLEEAQTCQDKWFNWTAMFDNSQNRYNFNGGGGGGGASMIWPRRADSKEFTDLPIAISPGGGGASAILDYEYVAEVAALPEYNLTYPMSASNEGIYTFHTNAHISRYSLAWPEGVRGFRSTDEATSGIISGAGGGWSSLLNFPLLSVDGKLLSQERSFAEGGFDCSMSLEEIDADVFTGVFGGYGGGGGGCGSGGGGGGYTGGHVVENTNRLPGGGGDSGVFNLSDHELRLINIPNQRIFNDGDGYVKIVASNCGCDGECVVYTEEGQFECRCPNNTLLAEDESSCYREINITVIQVDPLSFTDNGETFSIIGLQFENSSLLIFGFDVSLTVSPTPGSGLSLEEVACAVVFVGQNSRIVLASNPVKVGTGRANQLTILGPAGNDSNSFGPATDYVTFLNSSRLVTGAFLLTNGECSLASPFRVNISSEDETAPAENFGVFREFVQNSSILILDDEDEITTTMETIPPTPVGNVGLIIGLVILGCILAVTFVAVFLLFIRHFWSKKSITHSNPMISQRESEVVQTIAFRANESYGVTRLNENTENNHSETIALGFHQVEPSANSDRGLPHRAKENYKELFSSILVHYTSLTLGEEIGQGAFGKVYQGKIQRQDTRVSQDIAIKTIKNLTSQNELKAFFDESLLMKDFHHPNILCLTGVCFDTPNGVPFILLPLMTNGSLKDYLKKKRTHVTNVDTLPVDLSIRTLLQMCMDIASGMEYLAGEKFVHRDLAARNCMVDSSLQIKVGDFGLARDVYTEDYYRASKEAMLPVKWMAPETLLDGISNEKTDVWSYGVTCWEVFSLGRAPYPGIQNRDVLDYISQRNQRLKIPSLCPKKMYSLAMSQCWQLLPGERLTFSQLVCQLQEYWEEEHAYEHAYDCVASH